MPRRKRGGPVVAPDVPAVTVSATDLAYLAGVVDSDGYVTVMCSWYQGKPSLAASCGITGTSREPHDLAAALIGGRVRSHRVEGAQLGRETAYVWQRLGVEAAEVLAQLLPYLRIKRDRAEMVIQLQERIIDDRLFRDSDDPYPWQPAGYDPFPALLLLADEIRDLNSRTTRRSLTDRYAAGRTLDGCTHDAYPAGA